MENFKIKSKQEIKYFKEAKEDNITSKKENAELSFDLINGKINNSYSIYLENNNLLNNSKISFNVQISNSDKSINILKYNCDYSFGKEQKIHVSLINNNLNEIYPIIFTIGEILGNENGAKLFYIKGKEKPEEEILEIKCQKIKNNIKYLTIHFG